ncbi:unnamed protein product [Closterium sp. Yama58-4]|nr:unnamed protein product [Closterium sp. Yama58-4]
MASRILFSPSHQPHPGLKEWNTQEQHSESETRHSRGPSSLCSVNPIGVEGCDVAVPEGAANGAARCHWHWWKLHLAGLVNYRMYLQECFDLKNREQRSRGAEEQTWRKRQEISRANGMPAVEQQRSGCSSTAPFNISQHQSASVRHSQRQSLSVLSTHTRDLTAIVARTAVVAWDGLQARPSQTSSSHRKYGGGGMRRTGQGRQWCGGMGRTSGTGKADKAKMILFSFHGKDDPLLFSRQGCSLNPLLLCLFPPLLFSIVHSAFPFPFASLLYHLPSSGRLPSSAFSFLAFRPLPLLCFHMPFHMPSHMPFHMLFSHAFPLVFPPSDVVKTLWAEKQLGSSTEVRAELGTRQAHELSLLPWTTEAVPCGSQDRRMKTT